MKKPDEDSWDRLFEISEIDRRKWERQVIYNNELQIELEHLRDIYGIPTDNTGQELFFDVARWMDKYPTKEYKLIQEIAQLIEKYNLDSRWEMAIFYLILTGEPHGLKLGMGMPGGVYKWENGKLKHELKITPDVDITNPVVQRWIQERSIRDDPPPQPKTLENHPRKKDWYPVWEWHKRHPWVTEKRIAEMLNYSYGYLRRKLAIVEFEHGDK